MNRNVTRHGEKCYVAEREAEVEVEASREQERSAGPMGGYSPLQKAGQAKYKVTCREIEMRSRTLMLSHS